MGGRWESGRDRELAYECPIVFVGWYAALIYIVIMILCRRKKIFIAVAVFVVKRKGRYNLYDTSFLLLRLRLYRAPRRPTRFLRRRNRKESKDRAFRKVIRVLIADHRAL